ncbi:hypothetical protein F8388_005507 [Cannabis sativa]|uniref:DUF4283 domain-containing protein n=1 Tax=Cannabis sativa TaxID=3483 RepID=A0A7J6GZW0_CANSA|nr:hypothetical protein F8388_005507 [Cannabis sativa]
MWWWIWWYGGNNDGGDKGGGNGGTLMVIMVVEASVTLTPCASSLKALSTFCFYGKVVAPMFVDEATVIDFVSKSWHKAVVVAAIYEEGINSNYFEFGFELVEDRNWALDNDPWCIRGYSLILQAWSSRENRKLHFASLKTWVQIHNLPHEYYSTANGGKNGSSSSSKSSAFSVTTVVTWVINPEDAISLLRSQWRT